MSPAALYVVADAAVAVTAGVFDDDGDGGGCGCGWLLGRVVAAMTAGPRRCCRVGSLCITGFHWWWWCQSGGAELLAAAAGLSVCMTAVDWWWCGASQVWVVSGCELV